MADLTENDWKALDRLAQGRCVGSNSFAGRAIPNATARRLIRLGLAEKRMGPRNPAGYPSNAYVLTDAGREVVADSKHDGEGSSDD